MNAMKELSDVTNKNMKKAADEIDDLFDKSNLR